jgi:hypothetical protein
MKWTLKSAAKAVLDKTIVPVARYTLAAADRNSVLREVERKVSAECAEYVLARMQSSLQFDRREDLWDYVLSKAELKGTIAEFGVWNGRSINHIASRNRSRTVYGFDSFEGLKEDWSGSGLPKGQFGRGGKMPKVEPNVRLVKGWFDQTLPGFLLESPDPFSFVHVDCDTYEAASAVLRLAGGRIKAGTVLVFDEYFGYRGWRDGEYRAWQEFVAEHGVDYRYIAFSWQAVSVIVLQVR